MGVEIEALRVRARMGERGKGGRGEQEGER